MSRKKKNVVLQNLVVEDYAAEGKSIARLEGKVIFIENAVPGDNVDVRLLKNKKDWAEGVAIRFNQYSAERVAPFCQHFGICGGCQWQMLPYDLQLKYKSKQVEDVLKRIGKVELPLSDMIIGAGETRRYRNKLEYTFGTRRYLTKDEIGDITINGDQPVGGFHAKGFFDKVVDIIECHLQHEPTNAIRLGVKDFVLSQGWSFYDIRNHVGFLRTMQVRLCTTGELMVNIVVAEDDGQKIKLLMEHVVSTFPAITTLLYTLNTKWNDSLYDLDPQVYHGNGYVIEKLEKFQFKIGPKSFFQTNTKQAERLYQVTRDFAGLTGKEIVYDLYCGTGSIGIFLSDHAQKIIGVEIIEAAVEDAKINASLNGISSAHFFTGDVVNICTDEFFAEHGRPDVIITDPPRAGMHEKLVEKILSIGAETVVYVSCNPATQARDLQLLDSKYAIMRVQPVDMFPHTHHIENVVQLKLRH